MFIFFPYMIYILLYAYIASTSMGDFLDYIVLETEVAKYHHKNNESEGEMFIEEKQY